MKKCIVLAAIASAALFSFAGAVSPFHGRRIGVIGDSYVRNHRQKIEDTWHAKFARKHGMEYFNYGRNGNCIAFDRKRFGESILARYKEMRADLDYVVVIAGHNDANYIFKDGGEDGAPVEKQAENLKLFEERLDELSQKLRERYPMSKIAFVSPWRVDKPYFSEVIELERKNAEKHGFAFCDASALTGIDPNDPGTRKAHFQSEDDTAHLNPRGHDMALAKFEGFFLSLEPYTMEVVDIWPEGKIPSVQTNQTIPTLTWYTPAKKTSDSCLIVCPGGGYAKTAAGHEGYPVAGYFASRGMTVAMLSYRTPRPYGLEKHATAAQDAQRAVRIVRREAEKRGFSKDKIGMLGFSAGGHLTLVTATSSETPKYEPVDEIDSESSSLAFAVPVYPAYVLDETGMDKAARDAQRRDGGEMKFAPELKFDSHTPPMCLVHGDADGHTPMASVAVYRELRRMGIPAELHVFAKTPHGFGIYKKLTRDMPAWGWPERVQEWLEFMGFASR
ncbi:MAG: prolyl oligopeptidase family serine peptidase [Kiritimatiellae bacterium]|nr:prolyl oligopeptidase family serine peptidase [Kiritimatiellia bacterium]